jgi:glycosyltransferase involved in cell wall biosynthesis
LRNLAANLNVMDRVGFAGAMRDDELPEAYATSTIYLDASRITPNADDDGLGIALIEAQAAALPVVTRGAPESDGQLAGSASTITLRELGAAEIAQAVASLLRDADERSRLGMAGREAVQSHLNWTRVARDTARFVRECVANG